MSLSVSSLHTPARPLSRPSSRGSNRSGRAHSPSLSLDDPVALRQHMSTLKHSIRHQQAQLHTIENIILRGPRPLPPGIMDSPPHSPVDPALDFGSGQATLPKLGRRSSFEVLHGLAPDSSLPLPRRERDGGIREGVPMEFGIGGLNSLAQKRASSPTRTLSRIPVSHVGNARALADDGHSPSTSRAPATIDAAAANASSSSLQAPVSPNNVNKRASLTPGGTTKVLADLQTGVINARNALENTKGQLRQSQRSVAQLTRQTEDLKEGRERLRLENEGLNNVVARKERLLQEVLERARKAESEAATLKSQLKQETTASKKTIREMESTLSETTARSARHEREYVTLRDSIKGLVEGWKADTGSLREEMARREEKLRKEAEALGAKYRRLVEEVKSNKGPTEAEAEAKTETVKALLAEDKRIRKEIEDGFREEIAQMKSEVARSSREGDEAAETAKNLALELARLRRLMQAAGRTSPDDQKHST